MGNQGHRDRRSGKLFEALSEHATFRLGINYGFRSEFERGEPLSRAEYELLVHTPCFAYFRAPLYDEYLQLYEMYSKTCRLRDIGLNECEAAEAVRSKCLPDRYPLDEASFNKLGVHHNLRGAKAAEAVRSKCLPDRYPLDEASFNKLGVHHNLRGAFTQGRPLSQDEYEAIYLFDPVEPALPEGVIPYDDYVRCWYYGEMGSSPPSREEYMKRYCFVAPSYSEYLQLFKKYCEEC